MPSRKLSERHRVHDGFAPHFGRLVGRAEILTAAVPLTEQQRQVAIRLWRRISFWRDRSFEGVLSVGEMNKSLCLGAVYFSPPAPRGLASLAANGPRIRPRPSTPTIHFTFRMRDRKITISSPFRGERTPARPTS